MTRTTIIRLSFACLTLALAGCGGGGTTDMGMPPADGGDSGADTGTDSGPPRDLGVDMGLVYPPGTTCMEPSVVTGSTAGPVSSTPVDTTMYPPGMRDLGYTCGNPDPGMGAGRFPPQVVIEYHVAGTGPQRVDMTTANGSTPMNFDTVLQVRDTCTMVPAGSFPFRCFDDTAAGEVRSTGSVTVMGGSTLFVFVTGYAADMAGMTVSHGRVQVDFTQHDAHAPVATSLQSFFVGTHFELDGAGTDADSDAQGMIARLRDVAGAPVDLNGDGQLNSFDDLVVFFDTSVLGMLTFSGTADIAELIQAGNAATDVITGAGATQAAVTIFDQGGLESDPMMADIVTLPLVGVGVTCDASNRCRLPSTCSATTMLCELPPAIAAACGGATTVTVPAPTDTTTSTSVSGSLPDGTGNFFGTCGQGGPETATPGTENLYTVDVGTAGMVDLVLGTEMSSPATTDTLVYARHECWDPSSEVGCNDDIDTAGMDYRSHVEVLNATGVYTVFVEHWGGGMLAGYNMTVSLRPVLATGAMCDGAGRLNRCAAGPCPVTTHLCP